MPKDSIKLPGRVFRQGEIVRADESEEGRTIELSFSSEEPYDRWWGTEILGHSKGEMNDSFIGSGRAPLLVDHRATVDNQVGLVESVEIVKGVGRARVRFGNSERAKEIFDRVNDGELSNVSVGYAINKMRLEEETDDRSVYRVTDWTPYEISLVSIPADPTVGVGRSDDARGEIEIPVTRKEMAMPKEETTAPVAPVITEEQLAEARAKAAENEQKRIREVTALGSQFNCKDLAENAIKNGTDVAEFRAEVLMKLGERGQEKISAAADIGLTEKERQDFSFVRALNALANPTSRAAQEQAAFERECSDAAAEKRGSEAQGFLVPADVMRSPLISNTRDLSVGTATAGGHLVATDLMSGSFIDLLRKRMVVVGMGARMLNDLQGDLAIPRMTNGATAYWVGEGSDPTESQQAFDQVALSPNTVGAFTDYTRKLLLQSSLDVEAMVRDDLAKVIGLEIDRVSLYGTGASNQPRGVANQTGINTTTFAAANPTWAEVVALETAIAADDADVGSLGYAMNAGMRGALKTTEKAAGTAKFIWEAGEVNGYRPAVSNQVEDGDMFYGNWADLLIAFWSGLDLTVDPYTHSTSGTVRIVALQDVDAAVRHPVSFCHSNDGV